MNRLRRLSDDESGMSYVFIGMGMMAFLSASMLAIDVGMLMTARSQAQNSADAGALASAVALLERAADGVPGEAEQPAEALVQVNRAAHDCPFSAAALRNRGWLAHQRTSRAGSRRERARPSVPPRSRSRPVSARSSG